MRSTTSVGSLLALVAAVNAVEATLGRFACTVPGATCSEATMSASQVCAPGDGDLGVVNNGFKGNGEDAHKHV